MPLGRGLPHPLGTFFPIDHHLTSAQTRNSNSILLGHLPTKVQIFLGMIITIQSHLILFIGFLLYDARTKSTIVFCRGKKASARWMTFLSHCPPYAEINKKRSFKSLKFFTETQCLTALHFTHFIAYKRLWTYKFPI